MCMYVHVHAHMHMHAHVHAHMHMHAHVTDGPSKKDEVGAGHEKCERFQPASAPYHPPPALLRICIDASSYVLTRRTGADAAHTNVIVLPERTDVDQIRR